MDNWSGFMIAALFFDTLLWVIIVKLLQIDIGSPTSVCLWALTELVVILIMGFIAIRSDRRA